MADNWTSSYLRLPSKVVLKILEEPFIYHIGRDELYEIDERAKDFLSRCDGRSRGEELTSDLEFVKYCLEEELLELLPQPDPIKVAVNEAVIPSLRYLELQLLQQCNLKCLHCYLSPQNNGDLPLSDALNISREFSDMGGLRLMISGGEPLLYKNLQTFIAQTANLPLRRVLLSNGTLINSDNICWLKVEEIQFSLDGWTKGHDMLRGAGAFDRTMKGIISAKEAGIAVSFATMIHRGNLGEFDRMGDFIEQIGALEWGIDLPVTAGFLENHRHLLVQYDEAAPLLSYAFGGGYHGSSEGYACGRHLLTVMPNGQAVKCGFYMDKPLGDATLSLKDCWLKLEHIPLSRLECEGCPAIEDCTGGCRFRASHPLAPDPFMCALYGIS
ncbi:MAG TPA: radical SAM protein [Syntrophales bacterium]|nr:radical SAM protein [Syntrophales bacterium]